MYIRDTRERTGDEKSAPPRENKTAREQPIEDEKEREREKEAVVVIVSKVEDLKSYHFFVVYLWLFLWGDEFCFLTCLTSIYLVLLYNYYYY